MWKLEERGPMMIIPGAKVYEGMIIGEHAKSNDLDVNVLEGKKLTNIRAPPARMRRCAYADAALSDEPGKGHRLYSG